MSLVGAIWLIIQPLAMMVFALVNDNPIVALTKWTLWLVMGTLLIVFSPSVIADIGRLLASMAHEL